jgi:hypothetical protein
MYVIEYRRDHDLCAECAERLAAAIADGESVADLAARDRIDNLVGQCDDECDPSHSYEWHDVEYETKRSLHALIEYAQRNTTDGRVAPLLGIPEGERLIWRYADHAALEAECEAFDADEVLS